jgi:hypothetical protein
MILETSNDFCIPRFAHYILSFCFKHEFFYTLIAMFGWIYKYDSFLVKHPGNSSRFSHISTVLAKNMSDVSHGSIFVICEGGYYQSNSSRSVSFVEYFDYLICRGIFSGSFFNSSIDIVIWDSIFFCFYDSCVKCRIIFRISSFLCCDGYQFCMQRKYLSFCSIYSVFSGLYDGTSSHMWCRIMRYK